MFFPKKYEKYKDLLKEEALIKIRGKLQIRDDNKVSVAADVAVGVSADSEDPVPQEKPKKEYLGIILDEETEQYKDELIYVRHPPTA